MGERERKMEGENGRGHSRGRASRLNAAYCHGAQKGECNCDCDADCDWWLRLVTGMRLGLKLWPLSNELNEYVQRSSLSSVQHIQDTYMRQSVCVCISTEYMWDTVSVSCVCMRWSLLRHRQCLAFAPLPSHTSLASSPAVAALCSENLCPLCMCVCVCVSATVHLFCVYLSILYLARERFFCHCANYTKTTTSGSTDNVCHHMHHSARSNLPPSSPSPPFYCIRYTHNICASISVRKL